jgi:BASS family bile acid:Na+ symporter
MLKNILSFYTKYFAVWVVLFGVAAYFLPGPFVALRGYMDWFFALTMFGIGVVLQVEGEKSRGMLGVAKNIDKNVVFWW